MFHETGYWSCYEEELQQELLEAVRGQPSQARSVDETSPRACRLLILFGPITFSHATRPRKQFARPNGCRSTECCGLDTSHQISLFPSTRSRILGQHFYIELSRLCISSRGSTNNRNNRIKISTSRILLDQYRNHQPTACNHDRHDRHHPLRWTPFERRSLSRVEALRADAPAPLHRPIRTGFVQFVSDGRARLCARRDDR